MINWEEWPDAELAALSKALHEARFAIEPNDPLVWGSPTVIELHVAVLTEQQRRSAARRRAVAGADRSSWFLWRNRPEQAVVIRKLAADPALTQRCREDGGETVRNLLRPFVLEDADLDALLDSVDAFREEQATSVPAPGRS